MTMNYSRFAQQIVKEMFCSRVEQLKAFGVDKEKIQRLATFLALNQETQQIIYQKAWLHHLRRAETNFHDPDRRVLPLICTKLARNATNFRSSLEQSGHLRQITRDEDKVIEIPDLRIVLRKFGLNYINQEMFIKEFVRGTEVHVDDLAARIKRVAVEHYSQTGQALDDQTEANSTAQLVEEQKRTDYFAKLH